MSYNNAATDTALGKRGIVAINDPLYFRNLLRGIATTASPIPGVMPGRGQNFCRGCAGKINVIVPIITLNNLIIGGLA